MAANSIQINCVGINGKALSSAQDFVVPAAYAKVLETTQDVAGALCTVVVVGGPAGNIYTNYNVTDTMAAVLAMLNEDTVQDLTTVTTLTVGTDIHFVKEVNHTIDVNASTTAATAGGNIAILGGTGSTSGAGGAVTITGGTAGATASSVGGAVTIKSGVSGAGNGASGVLTLQSGASTAAATGNVVIGSGIPATSGNSGTVAVSTGAATTGNSGALTVLSGAATTGDSGSVTISTGNATTGASGNITLSPGTASTTVGKIITSNAIVMKHKTAAVNATATITAKEAATGYITTTSASAVTATLPTGTLLGAELGAVQGTIFDLFFDNTAGSNTLTVAVATNGILSAAAAANAASQGLLTVPSGVTGQACFRLMFSSATAYTFTRIA